MNRSYTTSHTLILPPPTTLNTKTIPLNNDIKLNISTEGGKPTSFPAFGNPITEGPINPKDDRFGISSDMSQSAMFYVFLGMMVGHFSDLLTIFFIILICCFASNQPLPNAIAEYIGYKYPYQICQHMIESLFRNIVIVLKFMAENSNKRHSFNEGNKTKNTTGEKLKDSPPKGNNAETKKIN